jgi:pimeloyl-ACP methyl ester carboxylesterase
MKVVINNQLVEYRDEGSGDVLLLLHGWGMDLTTFDQLTTQLKKKFRVIRFDFPGFGQSPNPIDDWSVNDYACLTRDILKKLMVGRLYAVVGHSFGGRVIIKGVSEGLISPEKVALIGTAGVKPRQRIKKMSFKAIAKSGKFITSIPVVRKLQPSLRSYLYGVAGSSDYLADVKMQRIFKNVIEEDLLPEVSNIIQPTLLLWGETDTETPLADSQLLLKALPHGRLVVIKDAGHFVYLEAYNKVIKELDNFL